jgi:hypothetical protein
MGTPYKFKRENLLWMCEKFSRYDFEGREKFNYL